MCKFLSGALGSVVASPQPISNVVLFKLYGERAFLMGCLLDVPRLLVECISIVSSLFNTSKNGCDFLRGERLPLTED